MRRRKAEAAAKSRTEAPASVQGGVKPELKKEDVKEPEQKKEAHQQGKKKPADEKPVSDGEKKEEDKLF